MLPDTYITMHTEMLRSAIKQHFQSGNKKKNPHITFGLIEGYH